MNNPDYKPRPQRIRYKQQIEIRERQIVLEEDALSQQPPGSALFERITRTIARLKREIEALATARQAAHDKFREPIEARKAAKLAAHLERVAQWKAAKKQRKAAKRDEYLKQKQARMQTIEGNQQ